MRLLLCFSTHEKDHGGEICAAVTENVLAVPYIADVIGDKGPIAECVMAKVRFCISRVDGQRVTLAFKDVCRRSD